MAERKSPWWSVVVVLTVIIIAGALRFGTLTRASLWFDEANMYHLTRGSLAEVLDSNAHRNSAPPLFALITALVSKVNDTESGLRFVPALAGSLAAGAMVLFGRALTGWTGAASGGLFLAIAAYQVAYAQNVREYSLSVLLAIGLFWAGWTFLRCPSLRTSCLFGLVMAVAIWTQYGLALVIVGLQPVLLIGAFPRFRPPEWFPVRTTRYFAFWLGIHVFAAINVVAVFLTALQTQFQAGRGSDYLAEQYWPTSGLDLITYLRVNTYGLTELALRSNGVMAGVLLLGIGFLIARRRAPETPLVALLAGGPFAVFIVAGLLGVYPFGGVRQALPLTPAVYLVAAFGIDGLLRQRFGKLLAGLVIAGAVGMGGFMTYRHLTGPIPEHFRRMVAIYSEHAEPGDRFVVMPGARPGFDYYFRGSKLIRRYTIYAEKEIATLAPQLRDLYTAHPEAQVWFFFSHLSNEDIESIAALLNRQRPVRPAYIGKNCALYVAQ